MLTAPGAARGRRACGREIAMANHDIQRDRQRHRPQGAGRVAPAAGPPAARAPAPDRHPHRLRHHPLRRLHRAAGRRAGQVLHRAGRAGRRPRASRPSRAWSRTASCTPSRRRFMQPARPAVRLLHARHDDDQRAPCWPATRTPARRRSARPSPATCAAAPATSTSSRRSSTPPRSSVDAREARHELGRRERRAEVCGMGHSMKRKEDPRFIRGQGNYVDDVVLPGMLYHGHRAQPLRPRQDHEHRHQPGAARCRACWP